MFRKLHYKLTGLCALITMGILFLFAALYLCAAEYTLRENHALSFQHDFDTICSSLEQQQTLTYRFLLQTETKSGYYLFLWDKGTPLLFNSINTHAPILDLAQEIYTSYQENAADTGDTALRLFFQELSVPPSEDGTEALSLQACITTIYTGQTTAVSGLQTRQKNNGLVLLILAPQDAFLKQLSHQRLLFGMLSLTGCLLLILFACFFTGKLLRPIRENQEKQLQFVANASHELRTPLAVILSSIDARPPHYEQTVREEVLRMSRLVDDMLTLTGFENHSLKLQLSTLAPDTFLLNLYEQFEPIARQKDISMNLALPEESVPYLTADSDRLKQLLLILLQNAVSYTPSGKNITLRLFSTEKYVCFQVEDSGIGIDDCEKDMIFERFYRADNSRRQKDHFGLGLCLAKEIAAAHHGRIEVSDTAGGGSTFTLFLPNKSAPYKSLQKTADS